MVEFYRFKVIPAKKPGKNITTPNNYESIHIETTQLYQ